MAVPVLLHQETAPSTPSPTPTPAPQDLQPVIANAITFFEESEEPDDPNALLLLDVVRRRFGIKEFADALKRYDSIMSTLPDQAPVMRLFRRIADHDNTLQYQDLKEVSEELDFLTLPALYCDQRDLPYYYQAMLEQATYTGDYMLTHALLAYIWIQENGCEVPVSDNFVENMYNANAALINDDSVVLDLELEAAAFLCLAGQSTLVDPVFVDRVVAAQNYDGGWLFSSNNSGVSNWHPSVLALIFLLHSEHPSDSYPPMLAPESP